MALDILIVDDEEDIRELVSGILSDEGFQTRTAHDSESALREVDARRPSLLILDIWLQGSKRDGLEILKIVKGRHKDLPVIMISGHGNVETAVAAIKLGAYDFIEKPFQTSKLIHLVERATEADKLRRENAELKKQAGHVSELTGHSKAIQNLRHTIDKVAPTNSRLIISGPAGSGKELTARIIHKNSSRSSGPFVVLNSANIEPDRMEQELFGVELNGTMMKTGLFEQAHGGTMFLDEVADMPLPTQGKILRALTDQTFQRVGGQKKVSVDIRVISATSRNLKDAIASGHFREDLYHRLNVVPVAIPSLSERREDIPDLINYYLKSLSESTGKAFRMMDETAVAAMQAYEWPGNVRQLRNIIERLLILSSHEETSPIRVDMLPPDFRGVKTISQPNSLPNIMAAPLKEAREAFEREYLEVQIRRFSGNISRTASFIGMERSALHRKIKTLGLAVDMKNTKENT